MQSGAQPRSGKEVLYAASTGVLAVALAAWAMGLRPRFFSTPWWYGGDSVAAQALVKGSFEHGWILTNPRVGMPEGLSLHDYPIADTVHYGFYKLLGFAGLGWLQAMHVYYLLGFALAAGTSLLTLRRLGVGTGTAAVASVLYALLPYHFIRGEMNLPLGSYYYLPPVVLLLVRLLEGEPLFHREGRFRPFERAGLPWLALCVFVGSAGIYYAFFACFFLALAGSIAAVQRRSSVALVAAAWLCAVICAVGLVNVMPSVLYWLQHGKNPAATGRGAWHAELYGLKLAQLLLPHTWHRLPALRHLKAVYNEGPYLSENDGSSLGIVGALGFLYLLGHALLAPRRDSTLGRLSLLSAGGFILATVGGVGSLFALLVSPLIRGYARISVFLGFFALAAAGLLIDRGLVWVEERLRGPWVKQAARGAVLSGVLAVGVLDQTSREFRPPYEQLAAEFNSDAAYAAHLEATLPAGSMIFQLPELPYPEAEAMHERMLDYDHLKPYLHSRTLRFSYGAMRGRSGDYWSRTVAAQPTADMLDALALEGFAGVSVDRFGYGAGDSPEPALLAALGEPITSPSKRLAFYPLRAYAEALRRKLGGERFAALHARIDEDPDVLELATVPAPSSASILPEPGGSVDWVQPLSPRADGVVEVAGWAFDRALESPARGVAVVEGSKVVYFHPGTGAPRPDVAQALHLEKARLSGWSFLMKGSRVGRGRHSLRFFAVTGAGKLLPLTPPGGADVVVDVR